MTRFYQHKKPFSRLSWLFMAMIGAGTVALLAFRLIGGEVGPDGMLNEPFYLLGMGYLLLIAGIAGLMASVLYGIYKFERGKGDNRRNGHPGQS